MQPHRFDGGRIVQPVVARQHAGLHAQRKPEIRLLAAGLADKAGRRDTDDGQRGFGQDEALAEHAGIAAEAPLPIPVADDGIRHRSAVLGGCEYPSDGCAGAQNLKESTRNQTAARFFPRAAIEADLPTIEAALRCHQAREAAGVIA